MDVTLLIADADVRSRDAIGQFFVHCGFTVAMAADLPECRDALRATQPDILIVDVNLPWSGDDGRVAPTSEGPSSLSKPPVVLVLGGAPADVLACRTGVPRSQCVSKPVQMLRLIDAVCGATAPRKSRQSPESHREESEEIIRHLLKG